MLPLIPLLSACCVYSSPLGAERILRHRPFLAGTPSAQDLRGKMWQDPPAPRKGGLLNKEDNNILALVCAQVPGRLGDMEPVRQTPGTYWGALVLLWGEWKTLNSLSGGGQSKSRANCLGPPCSTRRIETGERGQRALPVGDLSQQPQGCRRLPPRRRPAE